MEQFRSSFMSMYDGLQINLKLNENTGTTAYDVSGNGNNGTITGATWADDAVDNTLTNGVDYTQSGNQFTIDNSDYAWSEFTANYFWLGAYSDSKQNINQSIVGLSNFTDFVPIIIIALAASIVIGLILTSFVMGKKQR